jgi:hypothetical protein
MNTRPVSVLLLAAALSLSVSLPLSAAPKNILPVAVPVETITVASNGYMKITRGSDLGDVFFAMKFKNRERLASNVWVFHDFHANSSADFVQGCRFVVVTFADKKVVNLQLVNQPAVTSIAASLKLGSSAGNLASR